MVGLNISICLYYLISHVKHVLSALKKRNCNIVKSHWNIRAQYSAFAVADDLSNFDERYNNAVLPFVQKGN